MMKTILFASVLAVTIPAGFFSPTPLDSLTMNLNIGDSPRGRQHGSGGYPPMSDYEEDVGSDPIMTTTPPTTDAREQKVLEKIMQGIEELKELDKSGKLSPQVMAGGEECGPTQISDCATALTATVAKCVVEFLTKGSAAILTCINDALGAQSKCKPCVCYFMDLAGIPCPNPESGQKAFFAQQAGVEEGYIGCYANNVTPLLYGEHSINLKTKNSQSACQTACKNLDVGANFFGLENGFYCRCGTTPPPADSTNHRKADDSICEDILCPGKAHTKCGANAYIKVFKMT